MNFSTREFINGTGLRNLGLLGNAHTLFSDEAAILDAWPLQMSSEIAYPISEAYRYSQRYIDRSAPAIQCPQCGCYLSGIRVYEAHFSLKRIQICHRMSSLDGDNNCCPLPTMVCGNTKRVVRLQQERGHLIRLHPSILTTLATSEQISALNSLKVDPVICGSCRMWVLHPWAACCHQQHPAVCKAAVKQLTDLYGRIPLNATEHSFPEVLLPAFRSRRGKVLSLWRNAVHCGLKRKLRLLLNDRSLLKLVVKYRHEAHLDILLRLLSQFVALGKAISSECTHPALAVLQVNAEIASVQRTISLLPWLVFH